MGIKLGKPAPGTVSRIKISGTAGGLKVSAASGDGGMDLTRGLLAYWKGNGDDTDSSGNGINLTNNGSGYAAGLFGQAFDFSGASGTRLSRPGDDTSLNVTTGNFTMSMWYRPKLFNLSAGYILMAKSAGEASEWYLSMTPAKGMNPPRLTLYGYAVAPASHTATFDLPTVTLDTWHHILVRQSGGTTQGFWDGTSLGTATPGYINCPTSTVLYVGANNSTSTLNGRLDDVAIWGRSLSDEEVDYIWNGGAGNPVG